ncbi:MAG: hypothetical protein ABSA01_02550 [Anaerolineales bacterium]|jgi:hypothetical protein
MDEKVIKAKSGLYGRVNITLPLPVKVSLFDMQKKTGMKKAEFLRLALTTGLIELSKGFSGSEINTSQNRSQGGALGGTREGGA